ncbi:MAG: DegV family protein [Chloroflexota bacterium]|nr:DegV family protein [Chloroflexota bacterium]MDE2941985.1 DegV family protein [Chloroflexota bacterium]MDE3267083.1 DegV family protein [Chloroflexota bacterium]
MSVRIVTDSCSDLPPDTALACDIAVVPLYVNAGTETYRDGVDISADRFYELLQTLPDLPTTSQPSAADFAEVYERLLDEGHEVVSVHISSSLSGTCNSANQARDMSKDPSRIAVVDSLLAGGALGLLALEAASLAEGSDDHREVANQVEERVERQTGYVMVDTLKYLAKGGRIGKAQAFMGGALQLKPILSVRDGAIHPVERARTRRKAVGRIESLARSLAPISRLHVSYTTDPDDARALRGALADLVAPENIVESRFGPVIGTHLGPGAIGVAVTRE